MRGPIEYYGVLIPTQSDVFDHNVRSRFLRDSYETDEKKAIDKYFDNSYDLIDLGASTGFLTVYTIDQAEDSIRAVAIEANPDLIPLLEKTRNINNVDFDIDDSAYHSTKNEIEFYQHHLTVGGSIQRETEKSVSVSTINIKKAIKKYELTHPALIVDIEGGEADLLNNELEVLQNHCPLLLIEFHDGYSEGMDSAREKLNGSAFEKIDEINNTVVYKNNILN
jgi:FkbM family methyltransferase